MLSKSIIRLSAVRSTFRSAMAMKMTATMMPRCTSVAAVRMMSHGRVDSDLSIKLAEELDFEQKELAQVGGDQLAWLADLKKNKVWTIEDKAGEKEVTFIRSFGNEKVKVIFSTDAVSEAQELEEDVEGEEESEEESGADFPVNVTILIEKKNGSEDAGCLEVNAQVVDSAFFIDNLSYSPSTKIMSDSTAEGEWQRRAAYGGPVFSDLDEALQDYFHKYLKERGCDEFLAETITEYSMYKEQKEYMSWLSNMKKFIGA